MSKVIDLTNQKFGRLTVLFRNGSTKDGQALWHCKCDCGNECDIRGRNLRSGHTQSCGCLQREKTSQAATKNYKDLKGQRFGRLIALEPTDKRSGSCIVWKCKCDCGKYTYSASSDLIRGQTQSCGCLNRENVSKNNTIQMIGQRFGKLKVLQKVEERDSDGSCNYLCQCDCGNQKIINGVSLRQGITTSCGCINYSIGEQNIAILLKNHNIKYISEYSPKELKKFRYDFALIDNDNKIYRIIEFDGKQHYEKSSKLWEEQMPLEERQKHDKIKNQWCKDNNIPLVRIPYWERDHITLDMILGDQYLIK